MQYRPYQLETKQLKFPDIKAYRLPAYSESF